MSSVNNILSKTSANVSRSDVRQLTKDFKSASAGITQDAKFETRAELEKSGLDRRYDELQGILTRATTYETTTSIASLKLNSKQMALDDIRNVVVEFIGESSNTAPIAGTPQEKANKALVKIADILNRKEGGKYIFGGKNDNEPPVPGDITVLTDLNFTSVTSNPNVVNISDTRSVDTNMVTARDVAPFIKFLNTYKAGPGNEPAVELLRETAFKNHEFLQVKVENTAREVKAAEEENVTAVTDAREVINNDFTANIVEQSENMRSAMYALLTNFKVTMAEQRLQDKLQDAWAI